MKTELDYEWGLDCARDEGLEEGLERGREEGRVETARNFKCNGVPMELIAKCTGLSIQTIEAL